MTERRFIDFAPIAGARITTDGYMVAEVRCARTGCQDYRASEIGLVGDDIVTVYRPESAVFDKASLATYAGKPVTVGHPAEPVTADNWREHGVGEVGTEIARDGEFVRVALKLMDGAAIRAVQDGMREISMGYTTPLAIVDGVAPDGTPYQAMQTGPIRINHLAIVPKARGGEALRIGDGSTDGGTDRARWGATPITDRKENDMPDGIPTRTVMIDGLPVVTTDAGAQALEKLSKTIADMQAKLTDADARVASAVAANEKAMAAKDAEIADLKAQVLTEDAKAKMIADRVALETLAAKIAPAVKPSGLTDAALRKAVVVAKLGDAAVADKSEVYIDARFDILAEDAGRADPLRAAFAGVQTAAANGADAAYARYVADLQSAHRAATVKQEA
jgi:hypothetical protein